MSNHLGNVLKVITNSRFQIQETATGYTHTVKYYEPDVLSSQDYDPFGMITFGRSWEAGSGYRYGFNGYENNDEISGNKNSIDFGARIYNAQIGRFLSIDPRSLEYPWQSVYAYYSNSPIFIKDVDGMGGDGPSGNNVAHKGAGDTKLLLPEDAKILGVFTDDDNNGKINYGTKTLDAKVGDIRRFEVNEVTYKANFTEDGTFNGYWDANGNKYQEPNKGNDSNDQPSMPGWASDANKIIGTTDMAIAPQAEMMDYAVRSKFVSARTWSEFNNLRPTQQVWRTNATLGKTGVTYLKCAKGFGTFAAVATTSYSVIDAGAYYYNGGTDSDVLVKTSMDVFFTGVAFFGPIGFGISATYFIVQIATDDFNGYGSTN